MKRDHTQREKMKIGGWGRRMKVTFLLLYEAKMNLYGRYVGYIYISFVRQLIYMHIMQNFKARYLNDQMKRDRKPMCSGLLEHV